MDPPDLTLVPRRRVVLSAEHLARALTTPLPRRPGTEAELADFDWEELPDEGAGEPKPPQPLPPLLACLHAALRERGGLTPADPTPPTQTTGAIVRGRWAGRRLRLSQDLNDPYLSVRLALRGGPRVRIRPLTWLRRLDPRRSPRSTRIGRLRLEGDPEDLGRVTRPAALLLIRFLLDELGVEELELDSRWARARWRVLGEIPSAHYFVERLLDLLADLCALSDAPLAPRASSLLLVVLRCPYCHDSLRPHLEPAARCVACETLHHEACASESRACTTLGCPSRSFSPYRTD